MDVLLIGLVLAAVAGLALLALARAAAAGLEEAAPPRTEEAPLPRANPPRGAPGATQTVVTPPPPAAPPPAKPPIAFNPTPELAAVPPLVSGVPPMMVYQDIGLATEPGTSGTLLQSLVGALQAIPVPTVVTLPDGSTVPLSPEQNAARLAIEKTWAAGGAGAPTSTVTINNPQTGNPWIQYDGKNRVWRFY